MFPPIITALLLIMAAVLILLFVFPQLRERIRRGGEFFANALLANTHKNGRVTRLVDATGVFTSRYLIAKEGATAGQTIALCAAADIPLGIVPDMTPSTDTDTSYPLPVNLFGEAMEETQRVQASAAIAIGDFVAPAAGGQVRTEPVVTGTYYVIGRALTAAANAGDQIEITPMFFKDRVP